MTAAFYIYLANVLSNLDSFLGITAILGLVLAFSFSLNYWKSKNTWHGKAWIFYVPLAMLFVSVFIPKERTMWLMAGAVVGEKSN